MKFTPIPSRRTVRIACRGLLVLAVLLLASTCAHAEPSFDDLRGTGQPQRSAVGRAVRDAGVIAGTGVGAGLGVGAGHVAGRALGINTMHTWGPVAHRILGKLAPWMLRAFPGGSTLLPNLLGAAGGGVVNALLQKALTGKVDWGSVAFSSVGAALGASVGGIAGGVVGSLIGDLAWRGIRKLRR